ncbi:MAG: radical SAM protein [Thermoplasmata archaeon]
MKALCEPCGASSKVVSSFLGVCRDCILEGEGRERIAEAHRRSKARFDLPLEIPTEGKSCGQCVNLCRITSGEKGYCGIRGNVEGKISSLVDGAVVDWYYDPLPTNCVATFVCPGGTGAGYPKFAHTKGPEYGHRNLAVFYGACSFDCLFCQNWTYRSLTRDLKPVMSAKDLASKVDSKTSCVCYFGGDPTPQIEHAIRTAKIARERDAITRICFETNGSMSRRYLREVAEFSYDSGGCFKFDLKTWNEDLNVALCGTSNKNTLRNFEWLVEYEKERGERGFPFIIASTLMIPGYVESDEVKKIASFLADLNPAIPYSLLAFYGAYEMIDVPATSRAIADECYLAAKNCGLPNVNIGNIHLLS